jgi:hypothetical protein
MVRFNCLWEFMGSINQLCVKVMMGVCMEDFGFGKIELGRTAPVQLSEVTIESP